MDHNPFMLSDLYMIPKVLNSEDGAEATYKSIYTSKQTETGDHLSLGFGVGVGLPFLASVSVKGTYDSDVQENKDVSFKGRDIQLHLLIVLGQQILHLRFCAKRECHAGATA